MEQVYQLNKHQTAENIAVVVERMYGVNIMQKSKKNIGDKSVYVQKIPQTCMKYSKINNFRDFFNFYLSDWKNKVLI